MKNCEGKVHYLDVVWISHVWKVNASKSLVEFTLLSEVPWSDPRFFFLVYFGQCRKWASLERRSYSHPCEWMKHAKYMDEINLFIHKCAIIIQERAIPSLDFGAIQQFHPLKKKD
jgi:hypothetical protein